MATSDLLDIIIKISRQTDGRDKGLKFYREPIGSKVTVRRLAAVATTFSLSRKCIRLGHCLEPLAELKPTISLISTLLASKERSPVVIQKIQSIDFILSTWNNVLSVLNDLSDDIVCFTKIGVFRKETGKRFELWSNWLWLTCIGLDLYDQYRNYLKLLAVQKVHKSTNSLTEKQRLDEKKMYMTQLSIGKLLADLGFCAYDVFECQFSDLFQACCGFAAAYAGYYKLYLKATVQ